MTPVRRTPRGAQVATLNSGRSTRHPGRGMTTGSAFGPPGAPGVADHRGFVTGESPTSSHRGPSDVAGALLRPRCAWPDCAGIGVRLRRTLPVGPPACPAAQRRGLPRRLLPIGTRYFRPTGAALGKQSWSGRPPPPLSALEQSSAPDGPGERGRTPVPMFLPIWLRLQYRERPDDHQQQDQQQSQRYEQQAAGRGSWRRRPQLRPAQREAVFRSTGPGGSGRSPSASEKRRSRGSGCRSVIASGERSTASVGWPLDLPSRTDDTDAPSPHPTGSRSSPRPQCGVVLCRRAEPRPGVSTGTPAPRATTAPVRLRGKHSTAAGPRSSAAHDHRPGPVGHDGIP